MITVNQASGYTLPDFSGPVEIVPLAMPLLVPDPAEIILSEGGSVLIIRTEQWSAVVTPSGMIRSVEGVPPRADDGQQHD
jgi:hypothetical protein